MAFAGLQPMYAFPGSTSSSASMVLVVWLLVCQSMLSVRHTTTANTAMAYEGLSMCCVMIIYLRLRAAPAVMYHTYQATGPTDGRKT